MQSQCPNEVGTERGGCVHPKGANSIAISGLGLEKHLVGTRWAVSHFEHGNNPVTCIAFLLGLPEHLDRILINEWVWLESGWQCSFCVFIVWRTKTQQNL